MFSIFLGYVSGGFPYMRTNDPEILCVNKIVLMNFFGHLSKSIIIIIILYIGGYLENFLDEGNEVL